MIAFLLAVADSPPSHLLLPGATLLSVTRLVAFSNNLLYTKQTHKMGLLAFTGRLLLASVFLMSGECWL